MEKDYRNYLNDRDCSTYSTWVIKGESENAGFYGSHYMPELAICEGTLEDVCKYAITLKDFFTWGSGGVIEEVPQNKIIKVNEKLLQECGFYDILKQEKFKKHKLIEEQISDLEEQISDLEEQISDLEDQKR